MEKDENTVKTVAEKIVTQKFKNEKIPSDFQSELPASGGWKPWAARGTYTDWTQTFSIKQERTRKTISVKNNNNRRKRELQMFLRWSEKKTGKCTVMVGITKGIIE